MHIKELYKNCYTKIESDISFETDENYLKGIDKVSVWNKRINIYIDPAIKPLIKDLNEIFIDLKGRVFKELKIEDAGSQVKYGCKIIFGKDITSLEVK